MRQHLADTRPMSSRHFTDAEPVAMTTLAPLTSSSRAQSSLVASSETSTTARDIDAADERGDNDDDDVDDGETGESEDGVDIVDSYQPHDEECICDYDQQTESRFDFTLTVINFLNH